MEIKGGLTLEMAKCQSIATVAPSGRSSGWSSAEMRRPTLRPSQWSRGSAVPSAVT